LTEQSNVTWIENLIVQDDNFGPYYFFPVSKLEEIIAALVVILPHPSVCVLPHEATDIAVQRTIFDKELIEVLTDIAGNERFCAENKSWFDQFVRHLKVKCGDGLVLRPILRTGEEVIRAFTGHEFHDPVAALLENKKQRYFWSVELSWPDIYCFSHASSGMVVVDAEEKDLRMLHVPGIWLGFSEEELYRSIAANEDAPRPHHMPGV